MHIALCSACKFVGAMVTLLLQIMLSIPTTVGHNFYTQPIISVRQGNPQKIWSGDGTNAIQMLQGTIHYTLKFLYISGVGLHSKNLCTTCVNM